MARVISCLVEDKLLRPLQELHQANLLAEYYGSPAREPPAV